MNALRILQWAFTLIAGVEIAAMLIAARVWGFTWLGCPAFAALAALAWLAIRWRDGCVAQQAIERYEAEIRECGP